MKTRSGFVSNSSSSSFVCIVRKEDHEKIMAQLNNKEQSLISEMFKESTFAGIPIVLRGDLSDPSGNSIDINGNSNADEWENNNENENKNEYRNKAETKYIKALKKHKIETLSVRFDL